ncbi:MAG: sulfatase-like hydrolase/transferase [Pseudomonadota bacterium]
MNFVTQGLATRSRPVFAFFAASGLAAALLTLSACGGGEQPTAASKVVERAQPETPADDAGVDQRPEDRHEARPPNIVLIVGDDHGWPYYGFLGDPNVVTPNLDRLATEGALFTIAHVTANHCRPALQTLMTGLYPVQYQSWLDQRIEARIAEDAAYQAAPPQEQGARRLALETTLMSEFETLPVLLKEKGYVSFQGGKWWEGAYDNGGFDEGMAAGWRAEDVSKEGWFFQFMGGDGIELGRTTMAPVMDFIEDNKERPFYIWYGPSLPHTPLNPPPEHRGHYEDKAFSESAKDYYGNITWFDHGIGELVAKLDAEGVLENTLIVFVNDNGWEQPPTAEYKDDRDLYSNGGVRGKLSVFETAFRTPIFFHWPAKIDAARNDDALVSAIDLVPTILDYAGVDAPAGLPGYSLKPLMEGEPIDARDYLIGRTTQHRADSDYLGNRISDATDLMGRNDEAYYVRDRRWHFVWLPASDEMALYDMVEDPGQTANVVDAHAELVAGFMAEIDKWKAAYVPG